MDHDRPTTGPLVVGPVRGLWSTRDLDANPWAWVVFCVPATGALIVGLLERWIDSSLGEGSTAVIDLLLAAGAYIGVMIVCFQSTAWGDAWWRIDDQGVSHTPPRSEPTFLAWDDVEQVRLRAGGALRGRGIQVQFPRTLPENDRREVARRIRERLGNDFDLDVPPPSPRTIGGFIRLLAIGLALTTAFLATTALPVLVQELGGPRIGWIGRTAAFAWLVLTVVLALNHLRRLHEERWKRRRSPNPRPGISEGWTP